MTFTPHCCDGLDMDLFSLFPDLREDALVQRAEQVLIWTLGSGWGKDPQLLGHPTVWNDYDGVYRAEYFSTEPLLARDAHGWVQLEGGKVTDDEVWQVSLVVAVRDQWHHHLRLAIDGKVWGDPPDYNTVFYPLMAHTRGWVTQPSRVAVRMRARLERRVREWMRERLRTGLTLTGTIMRGDGLPVLSGGVW